MIKVCSELCSNCPFSKDSTRGFLATYTLEDFKDFINHDVLFPCHMLVKKDRTVNEVQDLVKAGKLKLCRGYVECMARSCKSPREAEFNILVKTIKLNLDAKSMSIWDFIVHHSFP